MITSRENPLVKRCRRLQASAKARREEGLFLAEGTRLCREALDSGLRTEVILATPEALAREPWLGERGEVLEITPEVAAAIADTKSPQGVFCLCAIPKEPLFAIRPEGRYLLLDGLQDPGNLGTIIRGAEAFGVTALVLGQGCPDRFSPKVLRSTMGSAWIEGVFRLWVKNAAFRAICLRFRCLMSTSSYSTSPLRRGRSPNAAFNRVDFPLPLGPDRTVTFPGANSRVTPCTTGLFPYPAVRFFSRTMCGLLSV